MILTMLTNMVGGLPVKIQGRVYAIEDNILMVENEDEYPSVFEPCSMTVSEFCKLCEGAGHDEWVSAKYFQNYLPLSASQASQGSVVLNDLNFIRG